MKLAILSFLLLAFAGNPQKDARNNHTRNMTNSESNDGLQVATFGNGCFWCTEAIFQNVDGVEKVESGYMGGTVKNPTYKEVCTGKTGHAEVIQITYDPKKVTYDELLEIFWKTHDPTTLNRQGADVGTQYRSVVFFHSDEQKRLAEKYKKELTEAKAFDQPIVTEITRASVFYKAEDYHQNYYNLNGNAPYCSYVIQPKVEKFKKVFKEKLKNQ
jgi:peptide-methionine (S)-S-oxide reductase